MFKGADNKLHYKLKLIKLSQFLKSDQKKEIGILKPIYD